MGQKVNPHGLRVGVIKDWDSKWYADGDFADYLVEDYNIRTFWSRKRTLYCNGHVGYYNCRSLYSDKNNGTFSRSSRCMAEWTELGNGIGRSCIIYSNCIYGIFLDWCPAYGEERILMCIEYGCNYKSSVLKLYHAQIELYQSLGILFDNQNWIQQQAGQIAFGDIRTINSPRCCYNRKQKKEFVEKMLNSPQYEKILNYLKIKGKSSVVFRIYYYLFLKHHIGCITCMIGMEKFICSYKHK